MASYHICHKLSYYIYIYILIYIYIYIYIVYIAIASQTVNQQAQWQSRCITDKDVWQVSLNWKADEGTVKSSCHCVTKEQ